MDSEPLPGVAEMSRDEIRKHHGAAKALPGVAEMSRDDFAELEREFAMERERHGADTFERCHKMVVELGSMLVHM